MKLCIISLALVLLVLRPVGTGPVVFRLDTFSPVNSVELSPVLDPCCLSSVEGQPGFDSPKCRLMLIGVKLECQNKI